MLDLNKLLLEKKRVWAETIEGKEKKKKIRNIEMGVDSGQIEAGDLKGSSFFLQS